MLGLGAINYFVHPTMCATFVTSYFVLLQLDLIKSLIVVKKGNDPLWKWKMKDCGYVLNSAFAFLTCVVLMKHGIMRLR